jgi:hypothetical protein
LLEIKFFRKLGHDFSYQHIKLITESIYLFARDKLKANLPEIKKEQRPRKKMMILLIVMKSKT